MADPRCSVTRRFHALARREPGTPALLDGAGSVLATRAELAAASLERAAAWEAVIRPGDTVVLSLPNSQRLVSSFLALRTLGARVGLVDATAPAEELIRCAETIGATRIVSGPDRFREDLTLVGDAAAVVAPHAPSATVRLPGDTVLLKLTSGSTGTPRAIAVGARQLAADTVQIMRTMGFSGRDTTLAAIPLTHSYGIGSCLVPLLLAGTPLVLAGVQLPAALAAALATTRTAHFPAVPVMLRALASLPHLPPLPDLRVCVSAGAPLAPADFEAFRDATGHAVHVFYGSSECGGITYDRSGRAARIAGAVGTAMDRVTVEAIDETGASLPPGRTGRITVYSRAVALAILPGTATPSIAPGRFVTGDLGTVDEDGSLTLTGRCADILNIAGKKVHPDEVRAVLEAAPGVREAVVIGVPDRHRGHLIAALVCPLPGVVIEVPRLLAWCRTRLAPHKVPRRIVLVEAIPVSDRGKLQRDAVLALLGSGEANGGSAPGDILGA